MIQLLLAIIYLSFISLGLPDSLLGSAWPSMSQDFSVPLSYAGVISMLIAFSTVISSLQSDRLTKKFGTGKVMVVSVAITALALFGFSMTRSFWMLCIWAVPYGLGGGSVDASLNNYVALHYKSRHMSWLHCMWGVGASAGPYIMGYALTSQNSWNMGYRYISIMQMALTAILFLSLPLWNHHSAKADVTKDATAEKAVANNNEKPLTLKEIIRIPGSKAVMIMFFCYCALEQTTGLWASSYMVLHENFTIEAAARFASMFFLGITGGRAICGFLTIRFDDKTMIRIGEAIIGIGVIAMIAPLGSLSAIIGLILIGLGCAPIYPCVIHSTPEHFGAERSQAIIGVQMACAYIGTCVMPPIFGLIANYINVALLPFYLLVILVLMIMMHEKLLDK